MHKRYLSLMRVVSAIVFFGATANLLASPVGAWKTIDDETGEAKSIVYIYEYNGTYGAKITKLLNPSEPNPKCTKCPGNFKDKPIEGMNIMWGLKQDGTDYSGGKIMDPNNGKIYDCKIWVEGNTLKVRGYLGPFFRTQTWYKVG